MMKVYICPKCGWIRTVSRRNEVDVLDVEMKRWFWQRFLMKNMGR